MVLSILIGLVLLGMYIYGREVKGLTLSQDEQMIVKAIVNEKQKALDEFMAGKEELITVYENLRQQVEDAVGLQNKLPMPSVAPVIMSVPSPVPMTVPVPVQNEPVPVTEPPPTV